MRAGALAGVVDDDRTTLPRCRRLDYGRAMPEASIPSTRLLVIRVTSAFFAFSSFLVGGWMTIDPGSFWGTLGLGGDAFVEALYGGAICGEGTMFALCAMSPTRYLVFFQYLVIYKPIACLAGLAVLLGLDSAPAGAWMILAAWASAGLISAAVFPWARWRSIPSL